MDDSGLLMSSLNGSIRRSLRSMNSTSKFSLNVECEPWKLRFDDSHNLHLQIDSQFTMIQPCMGSEVEVRTVGSCSSHSDIKRGKLSVVCWQQNQHDWLHSFMQIVRRVLLLIRRNNANTNLTLRENALTFFGDPNFVRPIGLFSRQKCQNIYVHQKMRLCQLWRQIMNFERFWCRTMPFVKQETEFSMQLWVSNFFGVFRGRLKLENAF